MCMFQADDLHTHSDDIYDRITGLRDKTYFGRPNWDQIFSKVAQAHQGYDDMLCFRTTALSNRNTECALIKIQYDLTGTSQGPSIMIQHYLIGASQGFRIMI